MKCDMDKLLCGYIQLLLLKSCKPIGWQTQQLLPHQQQPELQLVDSCCIYCYISCCCSCLLLLDHLL
jgi:hypothetical protein